MIRISEEVISALKNKQPVVALESTIISHGMPYPKNVETALRVEETIRANGAIPATIGIIDGVAVIGMSPAEIEQFGKKTEIIKVSRRDLPVVFAKKLWGATTVSATMKPSNCRMGAIISQSSLRYSATRTLRATVTHTVCPLSTLLISGLKITKPFIGT